MKRSEVVFLEVEDVVEAHAVGLELHGGQDGVRDQGMLVSAVMAAKTGYHTSLAALAAAYLHAIAKNHPFLDGNKRAAFLAALAFLHANGIPIKVGQEWAEHVEQLAGGTLSRERLVELFVVAMSADVEVTE